MRWHDFSQNSIESTLKGPFLAEKLQIRSVDTSSVDFVDSFPSKGKPTGNASRLNHCLLEEKVPRERRMRRHDFSQNSAESRLKRLFSDRETADSQRGHLISHLR